MNRGNFPYKPGSRAGAAETSHVAAEEQVAKAPSMLALIRGYLEDGPASPEELTERILASGRRTLLTSVRARVCQLHKLGLAIDSGLRGVGESGTSKVVKWRLTTPAERARIVAEREASTADKARRAAT